MATYQSKHSGAEIDAGIDAANSALPKSGGTMSGALTLYGEPSEDNQAATKKYVDDLIEGIGGTTSSGVASRTAAGAVIPGAGFDLDTSTGEISLSAAFQSYIGQTMQGAITFGTADGYKTTLSIPLPVYRMLRTTDYGDALPTSGLYTGRLFFKKKS